MSGFSSAWLRLREPLDRASRSAALVRDLDCSVGGDSPRQILDLGCGTGANLRYLAPLLGGSQQWLLLDRDPMLLAELEKCTAAWASAQRLKLVPSASGERMRLQGNGLQCGFEWRLQDLAENPTDLVGTDCWLVTASALLDLVSENWLTQLATACSDVDAAVLFTLTYDGCVRCSPALDDDALILDLVNRHQRGDKGFGAALGPAAAATARRIFAQQGYRLRLAPSDWRIDSGQRELQRELVCGWVEAAVELAPAHGSRIAAWGAARQALIDAGRSVISVGHQDLVGLPPNRS